jgi:hypothetical protein
MVGPDSPTSRISAGVNSRATEGVLAEGQRAGNRSLHHRVRRKSAAFRTRYGTAIIKWVKDVAHRRAATSGVSEMRRDAEADQLWRRHRLDHSSLHAMPGLWLDGGELEKIQMLVKPK